MWDAFFQCNQSDQRHQWFRSPLITLMGEVAAENFNGEFSAEK